MENLEFKGTKGFKISKIERDSSGRSCYRFKENEVLKATDEELKANALIFEVAPDLLEALQETVSYLESFKKEWKEAEEYLHYTCKNKIEKALK